MVFSKYNEVGMLENNRFHKIATDVAIKAGVDFMINISINKEKQVTNIFCGDIIAAFDEGVSFVRRVSKIKAQKDYDLIITHGGGSGLDSYYYQLAKSINIATHYLKPDGKIIIFGKCKRGLGTPVLSSMLENAKSWDDVMNLINTSREFIFEQWNAQFVYSVLKKASVYLYSDIYDFYPFLENLTPRVKDINKFIDDMNKDGEQKKDLKIGFIEDGPFSI
jgi:nickel-dependent lactate racemase